MLDPDPKTATVFHKEGEHLRLVAALSAEDEDALTATVFPDLTIPLAAIFA